MIDIEVRLFAALQQDRFRRKKLEFPQGTTVADVCRHLAIGEDEAAIVMVNGETSGGEHPLKAGDTLALFPPIGGG
jgi:sulfur carrier protein